MIIFLILGLISSQDPSTDQAFDIVLTPNSTDHGYMTISWKNYDYHEKIFKVFRSSDNDKFTQLPVDWTSVNKVKCLQIYPYDQTRNLLNEWCVKSGYGQDRIEIDNVLIDDFNSNPDAYLLNGTEYRYNVLFFGVSDTNSGKDLNEISREKVQQFIDSGRGVIFGHDTVRYDLPHFAKFADVLNLEILSNPVIPEFFSKNVILVKSGLISQYPNDLGPIGQNFTVELTHSTSQVLRNTDDVNFYLDCPGYKIDPNQSFYLTISNNVALIQTGHTDCHATEDEKKILANVIFYCNQLVIGSSTNIDRDAVDTTPPSAPSVSLSSYGFELNATDKGTQYYYYVDSYFKTDLSKPYQRSTVNSNYVETGISHFLYLNDDNRECKNISNGNRYTENILPYLSLLNSGRFLHVAAVDGAGNIGPITTVYLRQQCSIRHQKGFNLKYPVFALFICFK